MALPPPKRRKLSSYAQDAPWAEHGAAVWDRPWALSHAIEPLEEGQLDQPAEPIHEGEQQRLLPRQATAMPSFTASTPSVSSMGDVPATGIATTSIPAVSGVSDTPSASVATTLTHPVPWRSMAVSLSLPSLNIPGVVTGLPVSVVSGLMSGVSGLLAPSEAMSTSSTSLSSPAPAVASLSSAPNDTTSTSASEATTTFSTASVTRSTSGTNSTTSFSSLLPSYTGFITSSISRNSTTTSGSSTTESSSSTDFALEFVATFSQSDVTTLSRSPDAYTTALGDRTFTIAAAPGVVSSSTSSLAVSSSSGVRQTLVTTITTDGGGGGGDAGQVTATSYAAPISTEPASNSGSGSSSTPPAGTIAGGVVGGAAGLAAVVLIAMLALRWYRRQGTARHQALPQGPGNSPDPNAAMSSGPGMAERAGLAPFVAAVPAMFRNQNGGPESGETAQRGFTRVSGRKLPSAYGGGLGIQPPAIAPANRDVDSDLNGTSFFRDSGGSYGGDASSVTGSIPLESNSYDNMTMSPGPQRMPTVHPGGPYDMTPGPSSTQLASTLTRSDAPFLLDPNRNSRFSEGL